MGKTGLTLSILASKRSAKSKDTTSISTPWRGSGQPVNIKGPSSSCSDVVSPQKFRNGEIHNWYRIKLGYSDHLVAGLLEEFKIQPDQTVIDPFCGTGTTLVECMKRGIDSIGMDANPSSLFSAKVKTNWRIKSSRLLALLEEIRDRQRKYLRRKAAFREDLTYQYIEKTGMLDRGWISPEPLRKAIAIKSNIADLRTTAEYRDALMLALIAEVIDEASNVKFGPELYCGPAKTDAAVFAGFSRLVESMARDLNIVASTVYGTAKVVQGDARKCDQFLINGAPRKYAAVICSPPYPAEHDYTRNARLELAFLEEVTDKTTLRLIKKQMIRSHTKGLYKGDNDHKEIAGNVAIRSIVNRLKRRIKTKTHGFARLYPIIVQEYFGGMKRHFSSISKLLVPGAQCAYVVGDQSSYLRVHIPTAEILSTIAEDVGFKTVGIQHWRSRWSTTTSSEIHENILLLKKV
jgi:hypothetical protein